MSTSFRSHASAYRSTISRSRSSPSEPSVFCWLCSGASSRSRRGHAAGAVHRRDAGVERVAGLLCGEAEHFAEDQHRALVRRQQLKRGDEGEFDGLALLVAGVGRGVAVLDTQGLVGVGLDPDRLDHRFADAAVRIGGRPVVDQEDPLGRRSIASSEVLVAIRYSQERSELRPSNFGRPRQARTAPAARPRHPGRSRAFGSSARGARSGAARPAGGRRPRCPRGQSRAALAPQPSTLSGRDSSMLAE